MAVDESPDYQTGFIIVSLPDAFKAAWAAEKNIRRPTAIDGLGFDQFALAEPGACYGITSGGMEEVVVRAIPLSAVKIERVV